MDINEILSRHQRWINKSSGWSEKDRAILCQQDLSYADLSDVNLYGADLSGANLFGANLQRTILIGADMTSAILSKADLTMANLRRANLLNVNLHKANILQADFYGVNLFNANLSDLNINDAINFPHIQFVCPETGSFIGWKKALSSNKKEELIVKLEIATNAKRSSATGRKCRCNKANVLSIRNIEDTKNYTIAYGTHDDTFVYGVNNTITSDWDDDRWNECSDGIHFYITREEAVEYNLGR